jgi:hypothetical protein
MSPTFFLLFRSCGSLDSIGLCRSPRLPSKSDVDLPELDFAMQLNQHFGEVIASPKRLINRKWKILWQTNWTSTRVNPAQKTRAMKLAKGSITPDLPLMTSSLPYWRIIQPMKRPLAPDAARLVRRSGSGELGVKKIPSVQRYMQGIHENEPTRSILREKGVQAQ